MDDVLLALDFGGTKLSAGLLERAALSAARPQWLDLRREWTPAAADATYELEAMTRLARELLAGRTPAAVGVSFGGPVDYDRGVVRLSHHVRGWENMPLRQMLEREFDASAAVDNDANVAALGEQRFGAGRGVDDLLYVTVSTGVGGGWVLGGRPWRGHDGMAGEIGHTVVDPAGPLCLCGKRGCVERLASGPYMAADYAARGGRGAGEQGSGGETAGVLTGRDVAEAAAGGNALARQSAAATALPEVGFDVVPAELGDDAPLWGAVALVSA